MTIETGMSPAESLEAFLQYEKKSCAKLQSTSRHLCSVLLHCLFHNVEEVSNLFFFSHQCFSELLTASLLVNESFNLNKPDPLFILFFLLLGASRSIYPLDKGAAKFSTNCCL